MVFLAVLNIFLSLIGVKRSFKTNSFIIFVWLIVFYYSITSLVSLFSSETQHISMSIKHTYTLNMTLCILAFLASDLLFNKKRKQFIDLNYLLDSKAVLIVVEIIFWISIGLTYIELRTLDYEGYNTEQNEAGWAQVFFQVSSCIVCYFLHKKQFWKIFIVYVLVIEMVSSTGVRSLIYFPSMPIIFYAINKFLFWGEKNKLKLVFRYIAFALFVLFAVIIVNTLRYDEMKLPEVELTRISLDTMSYGGFPKQYFNSLFHYLAPFLTPIINFIRMLGIDMVSPTSLLPPSIPKLNVMTITQYHANYAHFPATIFHDFYMSFGYYSAFWAFVVFTYIKMLCDLLQKNIAFFFAFSSLMGWHLYFLMRGACDTCSSGICYSIYVGLILFIILNSSIKKHKV